MISQEVFLEAEAPYSTGLAGGFFTLKITIKEDASLLQNQHLPLVGVFDFILLQSSGLFVISECPSFHSYHRYQQDGQ
jgi:hypothetical protein